MFKAILTATDRVLESDPCVETAARLALKNDGRLLVLHVLDSPETDDRRWVRHFRTGERLMTSREYEAEVRDRLTASNRRVLRTVPSAEVRVTTGFPWEEILRSARSFGSDLIVMGAHSRRADELGVLRAVEKMGSTVEGVVVREKCPVMIVNRGASIGSPDFRRILVGIDFSASCECALCLAARLARQAGGKLLVFHMIPIPPYPKYDRDHFLADQDFAASHLTYFCREYLEGVDHEFVVRGGVLPQEEILGCAERMKADLIVMGSHTRDRQGKWYPGSAVERVSLRSGCPVMVISDPVALHPWEDSCPKPAETRGAERPKDRRIQVFSRKTQSE
ncbi:MAG: universal stress protein [Desulfobacterales bacterium]